MVLWNQTMKAVKFNHIYSNVLHLLFRMLLKLLAIYNLEFRLKLNHSFLLQSHDVNSFQMGVGVGELFEKNK